MPDRSEDRSNAPAAPSSDPFFVVGVGASAGGLEAVGELLEHAPPEMAYVVVQHLAPDHESMLTELLARGSSMHVVTAVDGMEIAAGHVYVIPPNADIAVLHGVIRLVAPVASARPHLAVDYLFRSLAEDRGQSSVGVVLSGTGADGTLGLEAIKAAGGFTFAQDPSTARYAGMPRSAVDSGAADLCLAPAEIARELTVLAQHPRARPGAAGPSAYPEDDVAKLFVLIRAEYGADFSLYKRSTIDRRIERRMMFHNVDRLEDYVRLAQENPEEVRRLYKDILISVTRFFRDPEAFDALAAAVFPKLFRPDRVKHPVRVWVPGCATGEEAYSIAIMLAEYADEHAWNGRIQVFGTDLDDDSIQFARRGLFPASIALDVSSERLNRYFSQRGGQYQIARRIRDMLVFSRQNLLRDAPFSRIDLISCRNLLIYLQPPAQKRVFRIFQYALDPAGHLFLGSSETVGDAPDLFEPVDRKHKIYARRVAPQQPLDLGFGFAGATPPIPELATVRPTLNLQALADRKVLELYGPPGAVVDGNFDVLQFRGHIGPFLAPAPGTASLNVLKLARLEIHIELKQALEEARNKLVRVTRELTYYEDGRQSRTSLDIVPLVEPDTQVPCFLVLFESLAPPAEVPTVLPAPTASGEPLQPHVLRVRELERELAATREHLRAIAEEKEGTLEELRAANEEMQSTNEELQSTNEELETSKEEMQSTNEELTTVNEELQNRMAELSVINDDLHNLLTGVENAVVIVGMDLRVRRFTTAAEKLLNLVPEDVGRSIDILDRFLGVGAIAQRIAAVIQSLASVDEEVLAANDRWYSIRVQPYKTLDHTIRGAIVTFVDIDISKRALDMTRDVSAYAAKFLAAIGNPLVIVDRKLRVVWASDAFLTTFQRSREEATGSALAALGINTFADTALQERLREVFATGSVLRGHPITVATSSEEHAAQLGASVIPAFTDVSLVLVSIEPNGAGPAQ